MPAPFTQEEFQICFDKFVELNNNHNDGVMDDCNGCHIAKLFNAANFTSLLKFNLLNQFIDDTGTTLFTPNMLMELIGISMILGINMGYEIRSAQSFTHTLKELMEKAENG